MRNDVFRAASGASGTARSAVAPLVCAAAVCLAASALACGGNASQELDAESTRAERQTPTGQPRPFVVTAYCTSGQTQSGARTRSGMAAADPRVLPVGSTIRVDGQGRAYDGIYTVTDTGSAVKGRTLDLYIEDCREAKAFGRRTMTVAVIRRGWDPDATPVATGGSAP